MTYDGSSKAAGLRLFLDGKPLATEVIRDKLTRSIAGGGDPDLALGERMRDNGFKDGLVDELHVFNRELTHLEVAQLHDGKTFGGLLASATASDAKQQLHDYFLTTYQPYADALTKLHEARDAKSRLQDGVTEIMVMREMAEPKPCYILERGVYDARGEQVDGRHPRRPSLLPQGST